MSIIAELRRRNIFRVALLYMVATWLVLQLAVVLFEQIGIPAWAFRLVFALLLICFPLVIAFSWVCEITPEGLKRGQEVDVEASISARTGQKISRITQILLALAILTVIAGQLIPEAKAKQAVFIANPDIGTLACPDLRDLSDGRFKYYDEPQG